MADLRDPLREIEIKARSYKVEVAPISLSTGNNQTLVTGVSGKIIRILGYSLQSQSSTQSGVTFINGSGGPSVVGPVVAPPSTLEPHVLPLNKLGYGECSAGTTLCVNVATASVYGNVWYINYIP